MVARRRVTCCDALEALKTVRGAAAIITSLPDAAETGHRLPEYEHWFAEAARVTIASVARDGVAIFYQGDRKHGGRLVSKAAMLYDAARSAGARLIWHKIVLRNPPHTINLYRPAFLHMMAFSATLRSGAPTPDVIEAGPVVYRNAMGLNAAVAAVRFAVRQAGAHTVYDPFCGRGTVLAVANALGCQSVGFDVDARQCEYARRLRVDLDTGTWRT